MSDGEGYSFKTAPGEGDGVGEGVGEGEAVARRRARSSSSPFWARRFLVCFLSSLSADSTLRKSTPGETCGLYSAISLSVGAPPGVAPRSMSPFSSMSSKKRAIAAFISRARTSARSSNRRKGRVDRSLSVSYQEGSSLACGAGDGDGDGDGDGEGLGRGEAVACGPAAAVAGDAAVAARNTKSVLGPNRMPLRRSTARLGLAWTSLDPLNPEGRRRSMRPA